jgi:hypothetical protein
MIRRLIGFATVAGLMVAASFFPGAAEATGQHGWRPHTYTQIDPGWHRQYHGQQQFQIIVEPKQRLELRDHHHYPYPAPVYGATWVPGFWHWTGYQWVWVSGRWVW